MKKQLSLKNKETCVGLLFLMPYMVGLFIFVLIPIVYSINLAFMNFNDLSKINDFKYVGLKNFIDILSSKATMGSFLKSLGYTLVYVPCLIIFSLLMAVVMNKTFKFKTASRTMIFMPYVANIMAVAILWNVILNPYGGPVNILLKMLGMVNPPGWLTDPSLALVIVALIAVWQNLAFQTIVFLAALQDVPAELYESASIDGASELTKFKKITLPWISPTTFFLVVSTIIGSTQNFSNIYTLTEGGPGDATQVIAISIFKNAFQFNRFSFASAQAVILFTILLIVTIIQWKGQKKWVNY